MTARITIIKAKRERGRRHIHTGASAGACLALAYLLLTAMVASASNAYDPSAQIRRSLPPALSVSDCTRVSTVGNGDYGLWAEDVTIAIHFDRILLGQPVYSCVAHAGKSRFGYACYAVGGRDSSDVTALHLNGKSCDHHIGSENPPTDAQLSVTPAMAAHAAKTYPDEYRRYKLAKASGNLKLAYSWLVVACVDRQIVKAGRGDYSLPSGECSVTSSQAR